MFIAIVLAVPLFAGTALVLFAMRGRLINNRPRCRACDHDLMGAGKPADLKVCPNCAADLTKSRAIVIGERATRRKPLYAGGALLLLCAFLGSAWYWTYVTDYNWAPNMPSWLLVVEAQFDNPNSYSTRNAVKELSTRLGAGRLGDMEISILIDRALTAQAHLKDGWFDNWDSLFQNAWKANKITETQATIFAHQFYSWRLRHRSVIRNDEPWAADGYLMSYNGMPEPTGPKPMLYSLSNTAFIRGDVLQITVGDKIVYTRSAIPESEFKKIGMFRVGQDNIDSVQLTYNLPGINLPSGSYGVVTTRSIWVMLPGKGQPKCINFTQDDKSTVQIVDQKTPLITLSTPDGLDERIRASFKWIAPATFPYYNSQDRVYLLSSTWIDNRPMNMAFDAFFVINGKEVPAGILTAMVGHENPRRAFGGREYAFAGDLPSTVTLILRPDAEAGERLFTTDVKEIWGKELIFKDLPLSNVPPKKPPPKYVPVKPASVDSGK